MSASTGPVRPTSEETVFRRERLSGASRIELRLTGWGDHETATLALSSNGRTVYIAIQPGEVRAVADALLRAADLRGWS